MILSLSHLPLGLANGFIPDHLIALQGDLDGEVTVKGSTSSPVINGELVLDSVNVKSDVYGMNFRLDNRPVRIDNSKLTFDNFSVYTRTDNPFRLTGTVDFSDMADMLLDLRMVARNYELVNASRKKNSVLYGKVYVDVFSTLQGSVNNLKMRGNVNVLGKTDVTYVLKYSPLTVNSGSFSATSSNSASCGVARSMLSTQSVLLRGTKPVARSMTSKIEQSSRSSSSRNRYLTGSKRLSSTMSGMPSAVRTRMTRTAAPLSSTTV